MISVIETGGKQYIVKTGGTVAVEKLPVAAGEAVKFDKVLLTANDDGANARVGAPYLEAVFVSGVCQEQGRDDKVRVVKFKRKVRYRRVRGHRQHKTTVKIS